MSDSNNPVGSSADSTPAPYRRGPVSFVRRHTKLSPNRQRLWEKHLGTTILDVARDQAATSVATDSGVQLSEEFGRVAPLVVDVGVGHGESTLAGALAHPDTNFLAVEVYTPGLAKLIAAIDERGVENIRAVEANAPEVLDQLVAPGEADEVWVFFPDPWQKTRYHKRRIIQTKFVDKVARALKPGGKLRLATDWSHYAHWMREVMEAHPEFTNDHPGRLAGDESPLYAARSQGTDDGVVWDAADARDELGGWAPRFETRPVTSFERKAQNAGRYIFDLTYTRR